MTRHEELKGIGYIRMTDIAILLSLHEDTVRDKIKRLKLIPFERWYYSPEQIELIKDKRL